MKILNTEQIRKLDAQTISQEGISSVDLMERAALAFCRWFCNQFQNNQPVAVFCGKGNNGGDGLAIARILSQKSYSVKVYITEHSANASADFSTNLLRLTSHLTPKTLDETAAFPALPKETIIIDALLGSGISRSTEGFLAELIRSLNQSGNLIVSVDIASGLFGDKPNGKNDSIIQPHYTVAFQLPKLAFLLPGNGKFVGEWRFVDIGLNQEFIHESETAFHYTDSETIEAIIKPRERFSHKGTFGHALIVAGSFGKIGAAVLSGKACLRSGVGLLTMHIPGCGYQIIQISVPEAMATVDDEREINSQLPDLAPYQAIGVGPGLGQHPKTRDMVAQLLKRTNAPLVIDADAINIIAQRPDLLTHIPEKSILTPHPKEFERLVGESRDDYERLEKGRSFAKLYKLIICLKGANTAVIFPDGSVHFNSTGNPGMATGGTGDVLTGVITSLLAQGYQPEQAAILGVYEHGLAGDRAASKKGESALIASDVIDFLRIDKL